MLIHDDDRPYQRGLRIDVTDAPDAGERAAVARRLLAFNETLLGPPANAALAVVLRGPDGEAIGGVWGRIGHGWLFIEMVFVPEALRGSGLGASLLAQAERQARARGCAAVWLDTFSPAARDFYLRQGYAAFGALDGYPPGHTRWFLSKRLDQSMPGESDRGDPALSPVAARAGADLLGDGGQAVAAEEGTGAGAGGDDAEGDCERQPAGERQRP